MKDGNSWHLGGATRWNSQFLIHTWTFLAIIYVASQLFLCLFWISPWLKNKCLQHPCFKILYKIAQASKNSNSNTQHFLSDLLTHSWFHSTRFALPSYQFPYIVMNRCLYLMSSMESYAHHLKPQSMGPITCTWVIRDGHVMGGNRFLIPSHVPLHPTMFKMPPSITRRSFCIAISTPKFTKTRNLQAAPHVQSTTCWLTIAWASHFQSTHYWMVPRLLKHNLGF
jgi:hypothetical protein